MSYYGLPPTKFANEFNEFEKLLRALPLDGAIKALDLLETITRNTAQNPQEEKFRRVRTTNEKLSALFGLPGIIPVMECMGWQQDGEFLQLPKSVKLDFPQHVVKILEAKSHFGKLQESEKRAAKLAQDPNKAELLKQLELDRRERGSAPKPEAPAAVQAMSEEEQLQAALKLSMETASATASTTEGQSEGSSPKDESPTPEPAPKTVESAVPAPPAPAPPAPAPSAPVSGAPKGEKKVQESAFDFKRREDPAKKRQEQEMSLADIRAMQKQKFKDFQADPNAKSSEAYKRPAAIAPGGSEEKGWFDWMWGGSSSSGGYGGGGGGKPDKPDRQGPKMKTIKDLPPPPRRAGG